MRWLIHFTLKTCAVFALMIIGLGAIVEAAPPSQSPDEGQKIFVEKCIACHTIGKGMLVGPDLQGVTTRREKTWLVKWITTPDQVLAAKDPIAMQLLQQSNNIPMPNLALADSQVVALIAFLGTQTTGTFTPPPAAALLTGNPATGKSFFTGAQRFANGGPPCMGCHSVGAIGALGGGALGPDLTPAYTKYGGDAGTVSFLNGVPTVTMNAVWSKNSLTPQEQADLVAFLKQVSATERPVDLVGQLAIIAAIVAIIFLIIAQIYWRKRLVAVRQPLVARMRKA